MMGREADASRLYDRRHFTHERTGKRGADFPRKY